MAEDGSKERKNSTVLSGDLNCEPYFLFVRLFKCSCRKNERLGLAMPIHVKGTLVSFMDVVG